MSHKLAVSIIIFINCIFCLKYVQRATDYYILITSAYLIWQLAIVLFADTLLCFKRWRVLTYSFLVGIPVITAIISFIIIVPEDLNVDRWSVIDSFLSELFRANYPYKAQSHVGNYPGPMPFYYLIALPFYALNVYSFLGLTGFLLLLFYKIKGKANILVLKYLVLIVLSIPMLWEIMALSNIITYSTIITLGLCYFDKYLKIDEQKTVIFAIILGLLLSTRSVFALAYVVFFLSYLLNKKLNLKEALKFTFLILMVFGITFVPLLLWFSEDFFEMNPFIIQSSFLLPQYLVPFLFVFALVFGALAKTTAQRFLYSGYTLFISILFYATYIIIVHGFDYAYFGSGIDLSYFLFSVPFLYFGIRNDTINE